MEKFKKYFLPSLPYLLIFIMTLCGMCIVFYDGIYKGHDYKGNDYKVSVKDVIFELFLRFLNF